MATPTQQELAPRTPDQSRLILKKLVRMFYDLQRLRLQTSGRIYKRPAGATIELHPDDVASLEKRATELENAKKSALDDVEIIIDMVERETRNCIRAEVEKLVSIIKHDPASQPSPQKGRKLDMQCRWTLGCKNRSKGPRFHFLCAEHLPLVGFPVPEPRKPFVEKIGSPSATTHACRSGHVNRMAPRKRGGFRCLECERLSKHGRK